MGAAYPEQYMTAAEFVNWDDGTPTRYELINGRPVAMAPPKPQHGVVAGNLALELGLIPIRQKIDPLSSFRRKPESTFSMTFLVRWTPAFAGVTKVNI